MFNRSTPETPVIETISRETPLLKRGVDTALLSRSGGCRDGGAAAILESRIDDAL